MKNITTRAILISMIILILPIITVSAQTCYWPSLNGIGSVDCGFSATANDVFEIRSNYAIWSVFNSSGERLAESDFQTRNTGITFRAPRTGQYYVRVGYSSPNTQEFGPEMCDALGCSARLETVYNFTEIEVDITRVSSGATTSSSSSSSSTSSNRPTTPISSSRDDGSSSFPIVVIGLVLVGGFFFMRRQRQSKLAPVVNSGTAEKSEIPSAVNPWTGDDKVTSDNVPEKVKTNTPIPDDVPAKAKTNPWASEPASDKTPDNVDDSSQNPWFN